MLFFIFKRDILDSKEASLVHFKPNFDIFSCNELLASKMGILNSKLIGYYVRNRYGATAMRGGFIELRTFEIEQIPIKISSEYKQPLINFVEKILEFNKRLNEIGDKKTGERNRIQEEIKNIDYQIDDLVYTIYGITEDEKEIIEQSIK